MPQKREGLRTLDEARHELLRIREWIAKRLALREEIIDQLDKLRDDPPLSREQLLDLRTSRQSGWATVALSPRNITGGPLTLTLTGQLRR